MDKRDYSFDEVCEIVKIRPYVLRFWETEFDQITSFINESGEKRFAQNELDTIFKLKKILIDDKETIVKAKSLIGVPIQIKSEYADKLLLAKNNLRNILKELERLKQECNI
ncbi:MAG: MerR family transcriptional regulator [Bacteriovoracaceae bacterium]